MITRVWHGKTSAENADMYLNYLLNAGTKEYKQRPGILSIKVWRKLESDYCYFYAVTEWENIEAVKAFAGEDYEKAIYYPKDDEEVDGILLEFEETVQHYESYNVS